MIHALGVDVFIPSAIELVRHCEVSDEGATGTIDATHFE